MQHGINLRTRNIRELFKEQYNQRLPHPDMNNSFGLWLTRRSVLSGNASNTQISQLWNDFTLAPSSFQGPKLAALHKSFRVEFRKLFGSTPISFHSHVSDIVPSTISSILQMLKEYSPAKSQDAILSAQKDNPKFAVLYGSFGAAYGPGAYQCVVPSYRSSAAGQPHPVVKVTAKSRKSLVGELQKLARDGCVAFIVEIVRSLDGRVMLVEEWSKITLACREARMLLIVDECLSLLRCGAGFAHQNPIYAFHGKPDLVLFGKGLKVCGIAVHWDGPSIESMEYSKIVQQEQFCVTTGYASSPCDPGVLIHAMGIIQLALQENWPERGLKIGDFLRKYALRLYTEAVSKVSERRQLRIDGLGSLIIFNKDRRRFAAATGVLPAGTGSSLRWLPTFDSDFENPTDLLEEPLGPYSIPYRVELVRRLVTWWCSMCGEYIGESESVVCRCGVSLCGDCSHEEDHGKFCGQERPLPGVT